MRLYFAVIVSLVLSSQLSAQTRPQDMPADLWAGFKEQFTPEGLITVGATGFLFAVARPQDGPVKNSVTRPHPPVGPSLADAGTWLGDAGVLFPAMGIVYGSGWLAENRTAQETGAMGLEALALGGLEAEVMKYASQRRRPDGSDRYSFPSSHATESFAVASVLGSQFGWAVGVPAYLTAGFVGYSRLQNNKHWLSDVVAGTGLGVLSGRAVWRSHHHEKSSVALNPWLAPGQAGAIIAVRF